MKDRFLKYNISVNTYQTTQRIQRERRCNGFTATNLGDVTVFINGKTLFPSATFTTDQGDSFSIGGNENEVYIGYIQITFEQPTAGTAPNVEIIQKYYVEDDQ